MSYVKTILKPGEKIIFVGNIHKIVYLKPLLLITGGLAAINVALSMAGAPPGSQELIESAALFLFGPVILMFGIISFASTVTYCLTTEIVVTEKRLIFKRGFISRNTMEMNIDKIESVIVDQSILGRMLNYGDVDVVGTGSSIEDLDTVAAPIALRRSIESA